MVGIMLVPGLSIQAEHDPATAQRLTQVEQVFLRTSHDKTIPLHCAEGTTVPANPESSKLLVWLDQTITELFTQVNLVTCLQQAGLSLADLDWIADQEYALGASFAIPKRRATRDELRAILKRPGEA